MQVCKQQVLHPHTHRHRRAYHAHTYIAMFMIDVCETQDFAAGLSAEISL